jgi:hypothetical protein
VGKFEARTSIQKLMKMCKAHIPLENSDKWNFPKFHELLHIAILWQSTSTGAAVNTTTSQKMPVANNRKTTAAVAAALSSSSNTTKQVAMMVKL